MLVTIRVRTTTEYEEQIDVDTAEVDNLAKAIEFVKLNAMLSNQVVVDQRAEVSTNEEPDERQVGHPSRVR